MTDARRRPALTDAELERALRDLASAVALPDRADDAAGNHTPGDDPARLARLRIQRGEGAGPWWASFMPRRERGLGRRRITRGAALALIALAVVAAAAGAIGLGLPGIRIVQQPGGSAAIATPSIGASAGPGSPSPRPTPSATPPSPVPTLSGPLPLGGTLGLGDPITPADASSAAGIPILLPPASGIGPPAAAWVLDGRVSLVWPVKPSLPATREPGVGLILSEFRGFVDPGYFQKVVGPDTTVDPVTVSGTIGYWISGAPHEIVFVDQFGQVIFDSRRIVGDTLLWSRDGVTYRLESGLDRAAAVALAETLR